MQCRNCGVNLVRGFTFCLECGMPVPPEMLKESGLPPRNIDGAGAKDYEIPEAVPVEESAEEFTGDVQPQLQGLSEESSGEDLAPQYQGGDSGVGGKDLKPQLVGFGDEVAGKALKAQYIGGNDEVGEGEGVKANVFNTSVGDDSVEEKLVFCPNCGMHMQRDPIKCEICRMALQDLPSPPLMSNGIPLFNQDEEMFDNLVGGFGASSSKPKENIESIEMGSGIPDASVDADFEKRLNNFASDVFSIDDTDLAMLESSLKEENAADVLPIVGEQTADMNEFASGNRGPAPITPPPVAVESVAAEPTAVESVTAETVTTETIAAEPVVAESVTAETIAAEPVVAKSVTTKTVAAESVAPKPVTAEPVVPKPIAPPPPAPQSVSPIEPDFSVDDRVFRPVKTRSKVKVAIIIAAVAVVAAAAVVWFLFGSKG